MKPEELGAWQALLQEEFEKPYWQTLSERVDTAYAASAVYPPREALFAAFRLTPPEAVRAVILGQDPYHEPGQANGLAFSVNPGVKLPPSLRNIFCGAAIRLRYHAAGQRRSDHVGKAGRVSAQQQPDRGGRKGRKP